MHSRWTGWGLVACLLLAGASVRAGRLDPAAWKLMGPNARELSRAIDNDIGTVWESGQPQAPGTAVFIDLGRPAYVYRVFLTPGHEVSKAPRSLRILVGETPDSLQPVASQVLIAGGDKAGSGSPQFHREASFRFDPRWGRYVRIELGENTAGQSWAIAELSIHGATRRPAEGAWMTVVADKAPDLPANRQPAGASTLGVAARDLQYYLMELLDQPVRLATADAVPVSTGLRFRLVTPPREQVPNPQPDPKDLDDVSVTRAGNEIRFAGPTPRAVAYSAYELLYRQGVRWVYPDSYGDSVPARKALDLAVLPISYRPPFSTRRALFSDYGHPFYAPTEEAALFFLRNGYNNIGFGINPLMGTPPRINTGFGYAHSMGNIFPAGIETQHPEWWPGPYLRGARTPCTSSPEVLEYILSRMAEDTKQRAANGGQPAQGYSVHPTDAPAFCGCPRCVALFAEAQKVSDASPDYAEAYNYADNYFYLINELAKRMQKDHPEWCLMSLAYANHRFVPARIDRLPDNVLVDMCLPWVSNLPPSSPKNAADRAWLEGWSRKCGSLGVWDYVLIQQDLTYSRPIGDIRTVMPIARPIIDQYQFLNRLGVRSVGTQAMGNLRHMPWALYAWSRVAWHPDIPADQIVGEFFDGYYGRAGQFMRQWYNILEQRMLREDVDMSWGGRARPELFTEAVVNQMRPLGVKAQQAARTWYEKERVATALKDLEWSYAMANRKDAREVYPCYRFTQAPVIDGNLDDEAWQHAPVQQGFRLLYTRLKDGAPGRYAVQRPTQLRMGWDDKFVYLGVECTEPEMDKLRERDRQDAAFAYRDVVEVFFAPDAPPDYHQTMFSSAGYVWGPMVLARVNGERPANNADFAYKTSYGDGSWRLEARFPIALVSKRPPKAGDRWPVNISRAASLGAGAGEGLSSWADLTSWNFHDWPLYNTIAFQASTPPAADARAQSRQLSAAFTDFAQVCAAHERELASFDTEVAGKPNLFAKEAGGYLAAGDLPIIYRDTGASPCCVELRRKDPVAIDAVKAVWGDRKTARAWYSLEWWDGTRYRLLDERRDNQFAVSVHRVTPVTTDRLRVTVWGDRTGDMNGWNEQPLLRAVEAYRSGG